MYFYLDALKIVFIKIKTLLSATFHFHFFLHSAQIHSLITKFFKLKSTNKNARNVIYKIKGPFQEPVQALSILIYCTFTKIRLQIFLMSAEWLAVFSRNMRMLNCKFSIPLLIYWPSYTRKKLVLSCFPTSWHGMNLSLKCRYPLANEAGFWSKINI